MSGLKRKLRRTKKRQQGMLNSPGDLMWYGLCTYWTTDWSKLSRTEPSIGKFSKQEMPGIPCCPSCGAVGFQIEISKWNEGVANFDKEHPGYKAFVDDLRENCHGRGVTMEDLWNERSK